MPVFQKSATYWFYYIFFFNSSCFLPFFRLFHWFSGFFRQKMAHCVTNMTIFCTFIAVLLQFYSSKVTKWRLYLSKYVDLLQFVCISARPGLVQEAGLLARQMLYSIERARKLARQMLYSIERASLRNHETSFLVLWGCGIWLLKLNRTYWAQTQHLNQYARSYARSYARRTISLCWTLHSAKISYARPLWAQIYIIRLDKVYFRINLQIWFAVLYQGV